jgi:hypothetical protein
LLRQVPLRREGVNYAYDNTYLDQDAESIGINRKVVAGFTHHCGSKPLSTSFIGLKLNKA